MTFDIRLLEKLSYDEVEPILDDYLTALVQQFLNSDTGRAYAAQHPDAGDWIATFVEMAYLYGHMSVPKMTKGDAQVVMQSILPRKLTLLDPSDADSAIPELAAFWTFIQKTYRFRSAGAISKYLRSIEGEFRNWMFDPARGGMAKSFLMEGMQAGYDMSTQAGVEAFQAEYNQRVTARTEGLPAALPAMGAVPMTAPPPDLQRMFDLLGIELPEEGTLVEPADILNLVLDATEQMEAAVGGDPNAARQALERELLHSLSAESLEDSPFEAIPLSSEAIATLEVQVITETEPGSILRDMQAAIAFVGEAGATVSSKLHHLSAKSAAELNQRLTRPVDIDLKRPQQKS